MVKLDWKEDSIGNLCEKIFSGGTPDTRINEYWNGKLNWLSSGETRSTFISDTEKKITELGVEKSSTRLAKRGDLVMACAGQGFTRGQTSFCFIDTYVNQSIIVIRTDAKKLSNLFLFYKLKSIYEKLRKISDSSSIRGSITCPLIKDLKITYPDLENQKKIATILSNYDYLIEDNERRIKLLEQMAKLIYDEWFVKFKFPGHEKVKMVDSKTEFGMIPEEWELTVVKKLLKRFPAGNKYTQKNVLSEGIVPVIDQSESGFLGFHNKKADHQASPEHPIMIFGDHTCKIKIMIKPFSVGPNTIPFISTKYPEAYIYFLIRNLVHTQEYKRHWNELIIKKVVIPSNTLVEAFALLIIPLFKRINSFQKVNQNLRKTRDLLLPKLISGEIDVSDLDIKLNEEVANT